LQPISASGRSIPETYVLGIFLIIGLVFGLLYVFLVPPWQHYDEPGHFEYARLAASRGSWPQPGEYDLELRQKIASSMIENDFFKKLDFFQDVEPDSGLSWIGYSQVGDPPIYYWLVSLPMRFMQDTKIEVQLYAGRLVSLLLYLITITACWGLVNDLGLRGHPLRWMLLLSLVLLPGFTDIMTSVNNDVGAIASFTIFLWGSIRLLTRGPSWLNYGWVLLAAVICFYTKNTVIMAIPLAGLVLLFSLLRGQRQKIAWVILPTAVILGALIILRWQATPAYFISRTNQNSPVRYTNPASIPWKYSFQLEVPDSNTSPGFLYPIPSGTAAKLAGKTVTIGAWLWSDRGVQVHLPGFQSDFQPLNSPRNVSLTTQPVFYSTTVEFPEKFERVWMAVYPAPAEIQVPAKVYYDGFVLAEGAYPQDMAPQFDNSVGETGTWENRPFKNYIRNPFGQSSWPGVRPWVAKLVDQHLPIYLSDLSILLDRDNAYTYIGSEMGVIFRTFWAKFGWGDVPLLGRRPYRWLGYVTVLGLAGAFLAGFTQWRRFNFTTVFILLVSMVSIIGATLIRGLPSLFDQTHFERILFPVARYLYPAIFPILLVLNVGWLEVFSLVSRYVPHARKLGLVLFSASFIFLAVFALWSINQNFHG